MGGCLKPLADWVYIKIVLGGNVISFRVAGGSPGWQVAGGFGWQVTPAYPHVTYGR
jgi:hypothetical protein